MPAAPDGRSVTVVIYSGVWRDGTLAGTPEPSIAPSTVCWCGSTRTKAFSADYRQCCECDTLLLANPHDPKYFEVSDSDSGFYSKDYWFDYLPARHGQPNVVDRARADLPERAVYWLSSVLRFQRPPGKILELGCGPGAFVGLLSQAGFQAEGLDLSPAVVELAARHFGVKTYCGPVEEQSLAESSYAGVALFDVLEHLPQPLQTIRHAASLLQPGGWMLLQTPGFRTPTHTYEQLVERKDRFLEHLKPEEHLYLYTQPALELLLERAGLPHVQFLTPLYDYDMYVIASREPLVELDAEAVTESLLASPSQRMVLALLDLTAAKETVERHWRGAEDDRKARMNIVLEQAEKIGDLEGRIGDSDRRANEAYRRVESLNREAERLNSVRKRTADELVRALTENERLQLLLCRMRLREIELESRLKGNR